MADALSPLQVFRRWLPLGVQVGYGGLKRRLASHPQWRDEEFIRYSRWLEQTQWWSPDEIGEYQRERLRALVQHAYAQVPYYRRAFDARGVRPEDIATPDDLRKLPLLTREEVRNNLEDLVARNVDRSRLCLMATSGSSGNPLGVYQEKSTANLREVALRLRQWRWAGYRFGDRVAVLRGNVIPEGGAKGGKSWWSYNPEHNQLILSSYDMTEENLFRYVRKLEGFQPRFIHAYPSSIEIVARFMKRHGFSAPSVKAIFCGSETLYPQQRRFIEAQFGCRIFARYGLTEKTIDAVECEQHQGYHLGVEYGVFELLDQNDEPIARPGVPGRVVGTGFDTFCMPLIRYATDDIAEYAPGPCRCHRQSTLIRDFKGRIRELIISKRGHVVPLALCLHGSVGAKILELKFVQERQGELVAQIAKAPAFSEAEVAQELLDGLYDRLDREEFAVRVDFVDRVPRTGRGKLGLLDQRLPIPIEFLGHFGGATSDSSVGTG
jgi:phenylacetate-CoA ligase